MSLLPDGEALRRAVSYIGQRRQDEPSAPLLQLIEEAARQFDLSPADEEFLVRELTRPKD